MAQAITAASTVAVTAAKMRRLRRASRACPGAVMSCGTGSGVIGASRLTARTMAQLHLLPQARPARQKLRRRAGAPATPQENDTLAQVLARWCKQPVKKCKEICVSLQPGPGNPRSVYRRGHESGGRPGRVKADTPHRR